VARSSIGASQAADRWPALFVALAIMAFPALRPHGPAHVTPDDVLIGASILSVLMWAGANRVRLHLPYAVPVAVLVITGLLAAIFSVAPTSSSLAVLQDVFVFAWAAAIANAILPPHNLSTILAAWGWSAVAWASIVVVIFVAHHPWASGAHYTGTRAQLSFDNPNMAGNYFLLSFFVLLLSQRPRNRVVRTSALGILFLAMLATGSNAALLALIVGGTAAGLFALWRRTSLEVVIIATAVGCALLIALASLVIGSDVLQRIENSQNPIVKRSIARSPRSAEGRKSLFTEEFNLYRNGSLLGIGPATTIINLQQDSGLIEKSAHDDYLATLVERGPIGAVGLLLLIGAIGVRAFSVARRPPPRAFGSAMRNPSIIVGAVVAMAVFATTHEILHYRHVWAFFGIIAGLYLFERPKPSPAVEDASLALDRGRS
jgi:hypothetical protein